MLILYEKKMKTNLNGQSCELFHSSVQNYTAGVRTEHTTLVSIAFQIFFSE